MSFSLFPSPSRLPDWVAVLALATGALCAAGGARAGGQGEGLPQPDFVRVDGTTFRTPNDALVEDQLLLSHYGAPAPLWRRSTNGKRCRAPRLVRTLVGSAEETRVVDDDGVRCRPVALPQATPLSGSLRLTPDYIQEPDYGYWCDAQQRAIRRSDVSASFGLSISSGYSSSSRAPEFGGVDFGYCASSNTFLDEALLIDQIGWFDGNDWNCLDPLPASSFWLRHDRHLELEIAATSRDLPVFDRAKIVQSAQQANPTVLCHPGRDARPDFDPVVSCPFTPAAAMVTTDGVLSGPADSFRGACDFAIPHWQPETACSDGIDNDGDHTIDNADSACTSSSGRSEDTGFASPPFLLPIPPTVSAVDGDLRLSQFAPGDLDGDGDVDFAATFYSFPTESPSRWDFAWLENRTSEGSDWAPHVIRRDASAIGAGLAAGDIDGDGRAEIIAGNCGGNLASYRHDGGEWLPSSIPTSIRCTSGIAVAGASASNRRDLLLMGYDGQAWIMVWLQNQGVLGWSETTVARESCNGQPVDVDGDGDDDVLATCRDDVRNSVVWFENRLSVGQPWSRHDVAMASPEWTVSRASDLDADGDVDIVVMDYGSPELKIFERCTAGVGGCPQAGWNVHAIPTNVPYWDIDVGDVDADGDSDILMMFSHDEVDHFAIRWLENRLTSGGGFTSGEGWWEHLLDPTRRAERPMLTDVDDDGDADLVYMGQRGPLDVGSFGPFGLFVHENLSILVQNDLSAHPAVLNTGDSVGTLLGASSERSSTCDGAGGSAADVWYRFTAPESGALRIDTCGTNDWGGTDRGAVTSLAIYSQDDESTLAEEVCDARQGGSPLPDGCGGVDLGAAGDARVSTTVRSGEMVWIRVGSWDAGDFGGEFRLHAHFDESPCSSEPCQNGGACAENGAGYACTCTQEFTGEHCELPVPEPDAWALGMGACSVLSTLATRRSARSRICKGATRA